MKLLYLKLGLLIIIFCLIPNPIFAYFETIGECSNDVTTLCNEYADDFNVSIEECNTSYSALCNPIAWAAAQNHAQESGFDSISAYADNVIANFGATPTETDSNTNADADSSDSGSTETLDNPIGATSIPGMFGNVLEALLAMLGSAAFLVFIYGGIMMITSSGNEEKIKKSRQILVWAALGVAAVLASYSIIQFVFSIFGA